MRSGALEKMIRKGKKTVINATEGFTTNGKPFIIPSKVNTSLFMSKSGDYFISIQFSVDENNEDNTINFAMDPKNFKGLIDTLNVAMEDLKDYNL